MNKETKRFKCTTTSTTIMKLKCKKCKHKWNYKGKAVFATCPSCLSKVKVR